MEKILVKYPTRSRPALFLKTLSAYIEKAKNNDSIIYLVSYDQDDESMTGDILDQAKRLPANIILRSGLSDSKIHACNRDIIDIPQDMWDIILLISDDMHVQADGWDRIIRDDFKRHFPDGDGVLWYHDGSKQKVITTLSCMGKKYYEQFMYLYYTGYKSFFSDNEFTEVAKAKNKIKFIDNVIIKHEHPQWGGSVQRDELYLINDAPWKHDQDLYGKRKGLNFPI